ncbi:SAM-dependent methyltransferase [Cryptosporangium aurantiacum]|uniref:S-adenosyl methyltransferase n=1 Tax=Cryptosporangium aurantiacum TaxID=134849 RepID=A0A1M7RAF5_9ACTN|nr:SAM-dependent methyltransferase [Cryptosporangium aurantiacum]SHN43213.1 S-adenosyl methyltransferase [Cryptosporangium aurantiacum]
MTSEFAASLPIDTSTAHPARRYDYWLGGKDNFAADRASGDAIAAAFPTARLAVLENRAFLRRAVTHLTKDAGVRQFLDIGTGLPSANNTHEVAQALAPETRVVYVDNDPMVLVHARALLTSTPEGRTTYLDADLRDPERILADENLADVLDLSQPVALMLVAVLHFVDESADPYAKVARLLDALPSGSYLVMSHGTNDFMDPATRAALDKAEGPSSDFHARDRARIERFFDGLELLEPGLVPLAEWRAEEEPQPRPAARDIAQYAAVGRKP